MTERQFADSYHQQACSYAEDMPYSHQQHGTVALSEQTGVMMRLLEAAADLSAIDNLDDLLQQSIERTIAALPVVQAGMLWLYDQRVNRLWVAATSGLPLEAATLSALESCQISPGEGLAGQIFQRNEPLIIETHTSYTSIVEFVEPSYGVLIQQMRAQLSHALPVICLPLRSGEQSLGVLVLLYLEQNSAVEEMSTQAVLAARDVAMLREVLPVYGELIAANIKNRQLFEQSQRHRTRLDEFDAVVTAISTATDLDDLLRSVLDVMLGLFPVSAAAIFLLDPLTSRLNLGTERGLSTEFIGELRSISVSESPCEEVVRYGQPMLRPLIDERNEGILLRHGLESCAYLPLLAGGTVVGVLGLYGDALLYKQIDMLRLMPLGNQVGFAIANVHLYEDSYLERNKLYTVINSIAEGVIFCDSRGQVAMTNETALELLNLSSVPFEQPLDEMPGFYDIRDLDNQPISIDMVPMARALAGEIFHDYRLMLRGASGDQSVMSFSGAPVMADDTAIEGSVVIFRDITTNQRLERAKDEFLAVTAHELRSPLAAVRGYAEMLLRREQQRTQHDDNSRDVRGLTILSQQVSHMLNMVDNLLDVSRLDAGQLDLQLERINLVSLVSQVLDQQRPVATEHELQLATDHAELWVECDAMRVHQVLTNLVNNAAKYSAPGSAICVQLATRAASHANDEQMQSDSDQGAFEHEPFVRVAHAYEAVLSVTDNGPGIPPDQQQRLFQRFYRSSGRSVEGLGLGLYLSREFVQLHGGRIWVESTEGQGSTFAFTLPMREG